MKILFVFTGGTIGSSLRGDYISPDSHKSYGLIEAYRRKFGLDIEYDIMEPYMELSENNTGDTISALINSVLPKLEADYDGIIVTHGTDTLQYSAAALAYAVGNHSIPICFVSSNYPIEHPAANGILNLHGAICFMRQCGDNGVWVVYKNQHDMIRVHRATRLLRGKAFSDDVESMGNSCYGWLDDSFRFYKNGQYGEEDDQIPAIAFQKLTTVSKDILLIDPYPGMGYPVIADHIQYILHNSYHSGTINTKSAESRLFFEQAVRQGVTVFLTGVSGEAAYESTRLFSQFQLIPLKGISPVSAYMKLWMCTSAGLDCRQIMQQCCAGDFMPLI